MTRFLSISTLAKAAVILGVFLVSRSIAQTLPTSAGQSHLASPKDQTAIQKAGQTFIENKGQWDKQVKFLLRSGGMDMWITDHGVVYDLHKDSVCPGSRRFQAALPGRVNNLSTANPSGFASIQDFLPSQAQVPGNSTEASAIPPRTLKGAATNADAMPHPVSRTGHVVRMDFVNTEASPVAIGKEQQQGVINYLLGSDSTKWARGVHTFLGATVQNLYKGVDAVFYLDNGAPRYDLVLKPGTDPGKIAMRFDGQSSLESKRGNGLTIRTTMGDIEQRELFAYQNTGATKQQVKCAFEVQKDGSVKFRTEEYDKTKPLVIDPLIYSTFLGENGDGTYYGSALDGSGNAFITSGTFRTTYPVTTGAYQTTYRGGGYDAFVSKLSQDGSALVYSTYLGGSDEDEAVSIAIDGSGSAYVTGFTVSLDFPVTAGAFQKHHGYSEQRSDNIFVTKLSPDGSSLAYSTYLGGYNNAAYGIAVDGLGSAYVTGFAGLNYPVTSGAYQTTLRAGSGAFVTKLSTNGSTLIYSTFLGGQAQFTNGTTGTSIAVDGTGNAYITGIVDEYEQGITAYVGFPVTPAAYQKAYGGGISDGFVAKLSTDGSSLVYSSFLGGSSDDVPRGIAVDPQGCAYITGYTISADLPVTRGAAQTSYGGGQIDGFVTKFSQDGSSLAYSTYLGGSDITSLRGIAVDAAGHAYVTGATRSIDYPVTCGAYQTVQPAPVAGVVTKLSPDGSVFDYSTYLSGPSGSGDYGIAIDGVGNAYVTGGGTYDYPTTAGAYQTTDISGTYMNIVTKLALTAIPCAPPTISVSLSPSILWPPNNKMQTITATVNVTGDCNPIVKLLSITANEPLGPADIQNADIGTADYSFDVRSSRLGTGTGRVYTVTYQVSQGVCNSAIATATITVPHDQGAGKIADGSGQSGEDALPTQSLAVTVHPNPAALTTQICVEALPGGIPTVIDVVNEEGERVALLYDQIPDGDIGFCMTLNCNQFPSGTYYVHVQNAVLGKAMRLVVMK